MRRLPGFLILGAILLSLAPLSAQPNDELAGALDRLTATLLELAESLPGAESNGACGDMDRVQTAIGILSLRYRKIERIESEIRNIERREEELPASIEMMQQQFERIETELRAETDQLGEGAREELEMWETQIRVEEDRLARIRQRRLLLENDLTTEQRRLTRVEAILDEWLDGLE